MSTTWWKSNRKDILSQGQNLKQSEYDHAEKRPDFQVAFHNIGLVEVSVFLDGGLCKVASQFSVLLKIPIPTQLFNP